MDSRSSDFITVDLRGMKAALVARSRAKGLGVSAVVRAAVSRELGLEALSETCGSRPGVAVGRSIKVTLRLTFGESAQLAADAREAGLSRCAYVGGLVGGVMILKERPDHVGAITASCSELSGLCRNIHHLAVVLRQDSPRAVNEYRGMLDSLEVEVRNHIRVAARALADMQPRRRSSVDGMRSNTVRKANGRTA